jgi:NSS family neurotransmitter:Na+ symporter
MTKGMPQGSRTQWGSRLGFILATIGAAVGLGNIWRFSYVAGENGGGAFLLVYMIFVVLIGLPLVIAELTLGRRAQGDVVSSFAHAAGKGPLRHLGWIGVAVAVLILSYYAVIAGWALKYFYGAVTGTLWQQAAAEYGGYFRTFITNPIEPAFWQAVILGTSMIVVAGGVQDGIERLNRWLMPILGILVVGLAAYSVSLAGSGPGIRFLLMPDWNAFGRPTMYLAALGQAFFSLGVGMAVFVTYGSYLSTKIRLPSSAAAVAIGDTLFAIVAGLAIFPAVFALGLNPAAGPELAFITLPQLFLKMPAGAMVGTIFFFLLSAAALTSMVSLLETPVAVAEHLFGRPRRTATVALGSGVFVLGLPSALGFGPLAEVTIAGHALLDAVDSGVSDLLLPVSGLAVAIVVGWRLDRSVVIADADFTARTVAEAWIWLLRTLVPATIVVILARALITA